MSGTSVAKRYGMFLPTVWWSPIISPLSDMKTSSVLSNRPVSRSARRIPATASSTESSCSCWRVRMRSIVFCSTRGRVLRNGGLSLTSSVTDGGWYDGSLCASL